RNEAQASLARDLLACARRRTSETIVETSRHRSDRHPRLALVHDRGDRCTWIELQDIVAALKRNRVSAALGVVDGALQLDRRLTLVGDVRSQATQRGNGIEQTPRAAR